jgi:acetyl esterase
MNTAASLDPDVQRLLDYLKLQKLPSGSTLETRRAAAENLIKQSEYDPPAMHAVKDYVVPSTDGQQFSVRAYFPETEQKPLPVLIFFHSGGFVVGGLDADHSLCARLAKNVECIVLSVDYRLAPEHRFPTAHHDAFEAVKWTFQHAHEIGGDPQRISLFGEGAGGNLAAVCAILARDAGLPLKMQMLFYPMLSGSLGTPSYKEFAEGYYLEAATVHYYFDSYAPDPESRRDFRFSPIDYSGDLSGIAPAWIGCAEFALVRDESRSYAEKLKAGGVPATYHEYEGMIHGFLSMPRVIRKSMSAHHDAYDALIDAFQT